MQALRDEITSSPISAPSPPQELGPQFSSSSAPESPTPPQRTPQHRKRPSEDQTGFVNGLVREMKLRKIDKDELQRHTEVSLSNFSMTCCSNLSCSPNFSSSRQFSIVSGYPPVCSRSLSVRKLWLHRKQSSSSQSA